MKENWTYKKLGEIGKISSGKSIPSEAIYEEYAVGLYPCYGGNGLRGYVNNFLYDGSYPIIGRVGALCGNVHLAKGKFYPTEHALVMSIKGSDYPKFVEYLLKSMNLNQYAKGVAQPVLSASALSELVVSIPPIETQSRIVSELDLLQSIIDKQQAQLKELDKLAQAVFYDMFGDPVENEKGWEVKKFEEIGKVITGNTPSTKDEENYSSNDYCFVKPSDIAKDGVSIIESTEFHISAKAFDQSRQLPKGSVLTTCIGIIGKVGVLKQSATCNQQINAIMPSDKIEPYYLAYTMIGIRSLLEAMANAPVVPIINKGDFSKVEIPAPPLSLQQSFAAKIESIEKQKSAISQSIAETQKLFNYTMDKYFG